MNALSMGRRTTQWHYFQYTGTDLVIKSDMDVCGMVEGAGPGFAFLELQLGGRLLSCPANLLHRYWEST